MKIIFNFHPVDWNTYINAERSHYLKANKIKQQEKQLISYMRIKPYEGKYPVKLTFNVYFKDKRKDLDNFRYKGILDGLVSAEVLKNDNLNCIQEIVLKAHQDTKEWFEINIEKIEEIE